MPSTDRPRSPLWLVILALLAEAPMHPYRMQALIRQRGKDEVANVAQRNSVYQAIAALQRAGLISVRGTSRHESRPERTTYELTPRGRETLSRWLLGTLAEPAREFPAFPAALSLASLLPPGELAAVLAARCESLRMRLEALERPAPEVPRLFLLESEYMAALVRAERQWLLGLIADLEAGRLRWDEDWLREVARRLEPPYDR